MYDNKQTSKKQKTDKKVFRWMTTSTEYEEATKTNNGEFL